MAEQQQKVRTKKSDQLVEITVDDSLEKIVELDSAGRRLRFNPDPDLFKRLAPDELKKLSEWARFAYDIARDEWSNLKDAQRAEEENLLANIEVGVDMGRATQRLDVKGKQEGYEYHWIRPDEKAEFEAPNRGWKLVQGGPERTLSNPKGRGPHVIGKQGSAELLLMKRPAAARAAERRAKKRQRQQEAGQGDEFRSAIEAAGLPSIGDEDGRGLHWRDRVGADDEE